MSRFGQLPEGGAEAFGLMDAGGVGNGTMAHVVVGLPSIPPVETKAGQYGIFAGTGQTLIVVAARLTLFPAAWVTVTGSNNHSVIVNGGFVMVLVQLP